PPQRPKSQWGYSGYSARIDSLQRFDRRAVLIAVIAPDLDSQIMPNTKKITFAKLSGGDNYTY
ncbi:hypothetical protein L249_2530, partial [Ophiocordyceps polyrhachis-furcata BCC 54312]